MKAIRVEAFGEPDVMCVQDVPDPVAGPGQVVVRVHAVGVNPVETYVRSGNYAMLPALPYTPGVDGAGEVESAGEGTRWRPGDRVAFGGTLTGSYAEKALCADAQLHALPANVSFEQGAALGIPYATAHVAMFARAGLKPGERVLVHGASGGVGVAAVQFARAAGATVVGTAGTEAGRALALAEGAHHSVDHGDPAHLAAAASLVGGGFDLIVEMLANVNLGHDLGALAPRGRVVVIGNRGTVEINPRDLMRVGGSILGMILWTASVDELAAAWHAIEAGLASGALRPVVGTTLPLAEAPRAHREILAAKAAGKRVLTTRE